MSAPFPRLYVAPDSLSPGDSLLADPYPHALPFPRPATSPPANSVRLLLVQAAIEEGWERADAERAVDGLRLLLRLLRE
jgi:hypothetical protein